MRRIKQDYSRNLPELLRERDQERVINRVYFVLTAVVVAVLFYFGG